MRCNPPLAVRLIAVCLATATPLGAQELEGRRQGIDYHSRLLLNYARLIEKADVTVLLATRLGYTDAVARAAARLGGSVRARFDDIGYLRVVIPTAVVERLRAIPDVLDLRLDGSTDYLNDAHGTAFRSPSPVPILETPQCAAPATVPRPGDTIAAPASAVATVAATAPDEQRAVALPLLSGDSLGPSNPYMPWQDMGAPQLQAANPTFDGRGVTVASVEQIGDLEHAALQHALTVTGDSIRKLAGIIDAESSDEVFKRVLHDTTVDVTDSTFTYHGGVFRVAAGRYRVGHYTEQLVWGAPAFVAVVWDAERRVAWIDTDRDCDLRDEQPLADVNDDAPGHAVIGFLPRDEGGGAWGAARRVMIAVAFDSAGGLRLHEVHPSNTDHPTMVAGTAVGHTFLGGRSGGVAPGARILFVRGGTRCFSTTLEGFILAARDQRVDVITTSSGLSTYPFAGDGLEGFIYRRLVQRYGKPILAAAGNSGPAMGSVMEARGPGVLVVGAYAHRESYFAHFGWWGPLEHYIPSFSGRGPDLSGGLRPDLVAPFLAVTPEASTVRNSRLQRPTRYRLPVGYALGGGTSNATPAAAGAVALLISGAKQRGLPHDAARINWALTMSARQLPAYQAYEQGHGLIDLPRAWELLQRATRSDLALPTIDAVAPVRHPLARYLRVPGQGEGLYETEGWTAGQTGTRAIALTRRSGRAEDRAYNLRWIGNDGTFRAPASVTLPLDQTVRVRLSIHPTTAGVHSALLELFDRTTELPVRRVLVTIVAAERLTAANGYTIRDTANVPWPQPARRFIAVPEGTRRLRVTHQALRGTFDLRVWGPAALAEDLRRDDSSGASLRPGVWQVVLTPPAPDGVSGDGGSSASDLIEGRYELDVRAVGADVALSERVPASGRLMVRVRNHLAPLDSATVTATAGTRRRVHGALAAEAAAPVFGVEVDSGTTSLRVRARADDGRDGLMELYLYRCTGQACYLWDVAKGDGTDQELVVRNPEPGQWKVVVDAAQRPAGKTRFTYEDVVTMPRLGAIMDSASPTPRSTGERWTVQLALPRLAPPGAATGAGRERVMVVDVLDAGAVVGTAEATVGDAPRHSPL